MGHDPCSEPTVSGHLDQELIITRYLGSRCDFLSEYLCNLGDRLEIAFIEIVEGNIELAAIEAKEHLRKTVG
jgi:hypothetical protein